MSTEQQVLMLHIIGGPALNLLYHSREQWQAGAEFATFNTSAKRTGLQSS
jgi:hypothetical protein